MIADDLDLDAGLAPDPGDELGAIVGAAAGFGGDAAGMGHALAAHLAGADLEGLDGAVHGGAGERAAGTQPLAQADDSRERIDDAEPLASRPRHQQPAVVGAEVERGQHSPVAADRTPRPVTADSRPTLPFNFQLPGCRPQLPLERRHPFSGTILTGFARRSKGARKINGAKGIAGKGRASAGPGPSAGRARALPASALESRGLRH